MKHSINETRKRSLLKAISFRMLEVGLSTLVLDRWAGLDIQVAFGFAVLIEFSCFALHFLFERVWNKIQYGRYIIEDK